MKSIKKYIIRIIAIVIVAVGFALPSKAQITPFTYFNVDWQFNAPLGNNSFANTASGWGMNFEGGYYILPDLAVGAFINYSTNNKYVSARTIPVGTTTYYADQQHSLFQLPFGATVHYRFMYNIWQPYIGMKLGAEYSKVSSEFYIYEVKDNTWGFYMSPEIGVNVYPWPNSIGFHLALYYSYATNKGSVLDYSLDNRNNIGFRLGVAF